MKELYDGAPALDRVHLHRQYEPERFSRMHSHIHRLRMSRLLVRKAIALCGPRPVIYEFGCAGLDLTGKLSGVAEVHGIECNEKYTALAQRYPDCEFILGEVEKFTPAKMDIVVLCEILEHLSDPVKEVRRLLPLAKYAVISHPVNEVPSGKNHQHCWSFTEDDFFRWFSDNNYDVSKVIHVWNGYDVRMALGRNKG